MPTLQTLLREGNVRLRVKKDGSLVNEQDFHIRIRADSLTQSRDEILLNTPGTPKFGLVYGSYGMTLQACDGNFLDEDPYLWDCVYNLSNQVEEGESTNPDTGQPQIGNPTEWIPVVNLGYEDYEEVFLKSLQLFDPNEVDAGTWGMLVLGVAAPGTAYNAVKWLNSAGQPYESGFVRQQRIITRQFTQFEPIEGSGAVSLDQLESRNDTLNKTPYLGRPVRTLKLSINSVSAGFYYSFRCWRVDYVIAYKSTDWRLKKLDVGWLYRDGADKLQPFKDETGNNVLGSLNGNGGKAVDQLDPSIRAHKEFESIEFSDFLRLG